MVDPPPNDQLQIAPGWYPHPTMVDTVRYWDGSTWTEAIAPATATPTPVTTAQHAPLPLVRSQDGEARPDEQLGDPNTPSKVFTTQAWTGWVGLVLAVVLISQFGPRLIDRLNGNDADGGLPFGDASSPDDYTCDDLADSAVLISADQNAFLTLLKVRNPRITQDNRDTYTLPVGTGESDVLTCEGVGVYSDGVNRELRMTLSVDSDGAEFVFFKPTGG